MRYLKLASAKNPDTDYIELNDLNGFLCTSFQMLGISRKLEFLAVKNRQFVVDNKLNFKKYSLTIEILSKYSEYEAKHRELITFLDRNKKGGFRLYFKPYDGMELRYCLCDIESSQRPEKLQPVLLTLSQGSLWFGEENKASTLPTSGQQDNIFAFADNNGYYATSFSLDEETDVYCVAFYSGISTEATIINNGYNEIPLNIKIYGECVNPIVKLFRKGEDEPIKQFQVIADVDKEYYLEIVATIRENGVWYVNKSTGNRIDYTELVNNELGSPYLYVDNGEYTITIVDSGNNVCNADIFYKEEYSE